MNEYYSPNINELHIGYEGFLLGQKVVIETVYDFEHWESNPIVTKYLTKEQIEAEGWKLQGGKLIEQCTQYFVLYQDWKSKGLEDPEYCYFLEIQIKKGIPYIALSWNDLTLHTYMGMQTHDRITIPLYEGECKSINELRTLMKWLKIK